MSYVQKDRCDSVTEDGCSYARNALKGLCEVFMKNKLNYLFQSYAIVPGEQS